MILVSRIEAAKGVNDVVELAKRLKDIFPFEINIYGDGGYTNGLQKEIDQFQLNNFVKLRGWLDQENMQTVINTHHLALFTSRFEGYPNILLDYVFSKVPIIATSIPTVKAVGRDFITYYDPGNIDQLIESILWCRNNYSTALMMSERLIFEKEVKNNLNVQSKSIIELLR